MRKEEEKLQIAICNYIRLQYPDVVFTSEASGLRLPIGLAVKAKKMRSNHTLPDLWILEPKNGYHGLIIELKAKSAYTDKGRLKMTKHVLDQMYTMGLLGSKKYRCAFINSFDKAKEFIDNYMIERDGVTLNKNR